MSGPIGTAGLVDVRVVAMPLDAYREASEHGDELLREFALIRASDTEVPRRLVSLVDRLGVEFRGFTAEQDATCGPPSSAATTPSTSSSACPRGSSRR